jgi:enoyl-CoA hydratase/carnithine racemase
MATPAIDTGTNDLLAHVEDGVAVLTMNRPERRNALSPDMLDAMARLLAQASPWHSPAISVSPPTVR